MEIERITTIRFGSVSGSGGAISVSYSPESGWIEIYAHDPDDLRKAGIFVGLNDDGFQKLKRLLSAVDDVVHAEVKRRAQESEAHSDRISSQERLVVIQVLGSSISLPISLYTEVAALVSEGKTAVAASLIGKSLTWLSASGATEVALTIREHQCSQGVRE